MTSLVIGASGHLGAHLVRELLADRDAVRVMVRPTSDLRALAELDVEVKHGDIRDPQSIAAAMRGCRNVYHLGAPTRIESQLFRTLVGGARLVLESASVAGVERVVYTSSTVVSHHICNAANMNELSQSISIVVPVYKEEGNIAEFLDACARDLTRLQRTGRSSSH